MDNGLILDLFLVLAAALLGGLLAKFTKLPTLVGYILAGLIANLVLPVFGLLTKNAELLNIQSLAELGIILLMFSIGLEVSIKKLYKLGKFILVGSIAQILLTAAFSWVGLMLFGFASNAAVVFAVAFSLSSTAIVVKLLTDRNEKGTVHGEIMIGWLLIQDLAVIPIMSLLPALAGGGNSFLPLIGKSLLSAGISIFAVFFLGRLVVPPVVHKVASLNSRELLSLTAFCIAIGTAFLVSAFGVSAALGAFLAGVVISESQENHAVFAEVRPLRDLFVILFFVTLGLLVNPYAVITHLPLILGLTIFVLVLKTLINSFIMVGAGYFGKTAVAISLGLSQIGEFSFVIYLAAVSLGIIDATMASVGITVTLLTLMATPFMFKNILPIWRKLKNTPKLGKYFWRGFNKEVDDLEFKNHVVVCGFGRVGKWVAKALDDAKIDYVVVDYNQEKVFRARAGGLKVVYGDASEPEVLAEVDITSAKAVVLTVPDTVARHEAISHIQTVAPNVKIFVRVDLDEDIQHLKALRVERIVQPEFEGALTLIRDLYRTMGKSKDQINEKMKGLRLSHAH